jgi:hypothetical protein
MGQRNKMKKKLCIFYEPKTEEEGICSYDNSSVNINAGCFGDYDNCRKIKIIGKDDKRFGYQESYFTKLVNGIKEFFEEDELIKSSAEHYPVSKKSKLEDKSHVDIDLLEK